MDFRTSNIENFLTTNRFFFVKIFLFFLFLSVAIFLPQTWFKEKFLTIIGFVLYYLLLNVIGNVFSKVIILLYFRRNKYSKDHVDNFTIGIENITTFLTSLVFIVVLLIGLGVDLRALLTSISIFAAALVLTFRDYLSNFFNGMTIMFSEDFKVNETVKVGDQKGKITNITFLNTELKNEQGDIIYIPNQLFLSKEVINYSKQTNKKLQIPITLKSTYYEFFDEYIEYITSEVPKKIESTAVGEITVSVSQIKRTSSEITIEVTINRFSHKLEGELKTVISRLSFAFITSKEKELQKKSSNI